ncbi:30S ribosomal protein S16 [Chloroflexota bacterium]
MRYISARVVLTEETPGQATQRMVKMVKIRLRRVGAKNSPSYRLVVSDSRSPRDGAFIAIIGHYNALTDPETVSIDEEKALSWLKQGAQPTATAARLLTKVGIMEKHKTTKETT